MVLLSCLFIFTPTEKNKKFTNVFTRNISGIKISNVVTKETSQTLPQTLRHLRKPQINLVSLWGDSFTDVGQNIGQVERLLGCINRCHRLFWTGLLLTLTGLNNVCACAKIKSNFRANVMCGSFMFSCMTTTGKRRKFSIILAPKRKYIPLMMWKMTIWTLWSYIEVFSLRYAEEYKKTCR